MANLWMNVYVLICILKGHMLMAMLNYQTHVASLWSATSLCKRRRLHWQMFPKDLTTVILAVNHVTSRGAVVHVWVLSCWWTYIAQARVRIMVITTSTCVRCVYDATNKCWMVSIQNLSLDNHSRVRLNRAQITPGPQQLQAQCFHRPPLGDQLLSHRFCGSSTLLAVWNSSCLGAISHGASTFYLAMIASKMKEWPWQRSMVNNCTWWSLDMYFLILPPNSVHRFMYGSEGAHQAACHPLQCRCVHSTQDCKYNVFMRMCSCTSWLSDCSGCRCNFLRVFFIVCNYYLLPQSCGLKIHPLSDRYIQLVWSVYQQSP